MRDSEIGSGLKRVRQRRDDALARLSWPKVERLLAQYYREQGWQVEHSGTGGSGGRFDGGIDIKLRRDDEYVLVQCKHWNAYQVTHNPVHELLGVMVNQGATGAILVTSGEFTDYAIESAEKLGHVQLIDGNRLRQMLDLPEIVPEPPPLTAPALQSPSAPRDSHLALIGFGLFAVAAMLFAVWWKLPDPKADAENLRQAQRDALARDVRASAARDAALLAAQQPATATATAGIAKDPPRRKPDPNRPIDAEAARKAARSVAGVRSAVWIDAGNLLVRVDHLRLRNHATIDRVCERLDPLGDTLAVVVHVQSASARNAEELRSISRNCQLPPGENAEGQQQRSLEPVPEAMRAQYRHDNATPRQPVSSRDRAARERMLERTPEM